MAAMALAAAACLAAWAVLPAPLNSSAPTRSNTLKSAMGCDGEYLNEDVSCVISESVKIEALAN